MIETQSRDDAAPASVSLADATRAWAEVGLNSFGGPAGQIAVLHRVIVEQRGWVDERRFLHALNYCMLLPGPEAQQLATYLGWVLHGVRGGLIAGLLFIIPGVVAILGLSLLYAGYQDAALVDGLFYGVKPVVVAIVISAVVKIGRRALNDPLLLSMAAGAFIAIFLLRVPFPLIVVAAAGFGALVGRLAPGRFATETDDGPAVGRAIDVPLPALRHTFRTLVVGLGLWLGPVVVLAALVGSTHLFSQLTAFFSVAAVVTFGGAYAVLAFVAQQAVETYGWLQPGEMLDGLGMAETTPGPLIMVVQFVGFMAAYRDPGALSPVLAGLVGALLTVWVTFVPSFLWIFLGAPYAEHLRSRRTLQSALRGVTAAVVGVILNLAVWFGVHTAFAVVHETDLGPLRVLWPELASIDLGAATITLLAMVALFILRWPMLTTLAVGAALGVLVTLAGVR